MQWLSFEFGSILYNPPVWNILESIMLQRGEFDYLHSTSVECFEEYAVATTGVGKFH